MGTVPQFFNKLFGPNWGAWTLTVLSFVALFITVYPESVTIIPSDYWQRTVVQIVQFLFAVGVLRKTHTDEKKIEEVKEELKTIKEDQ